MILREYCFRRGPFPDALRDDSVDAVKYLIDDERDLGPVSRFQLLHDISHVHLDRAFLHVEFVGNRLVGLAPPQSLDHGQLTRG